MINMMLIIKPTKKLMVSYVVGDLALIDIVQYLYALPIDYLLHSSLCIKLQLEPNITLIKMSLFCLTIAEFSFIHCEHKGFHCSIAMNGGEYYCINPD